MVYARQPSDEGARGLGGEEAALLPGGQGVLRPVRRALVQASPASAFFSFLIFSPSRFIRFDCPKNPEFWLRVPITRRQFEEIAAGQQLVVFAEGRVGRKAGRVDVLVKPTGDMEASCIANPEFWMEARVALGTGTEQN